MLRTIRRLVARIRYRHFEDDLERELAVHRAMLEEEARERGASVPQARYEAARQLGNTTLARETARGVWLAPWLEGLWQDVRYAARGLCASPSFTLPALAVLVITMGLTTGLYATVESVLLRPWPVHEPHRVVAVNVSRPLGASTTHSVGMVEYEHLKNGAQSLDLIAATIFRSVRIGQADNTESVAVRVVSGNYFEVLRLPVAAGRPIRPSDDVEGDASAVAVISYELWQRRFGGDGDVVGSTMAFRDVSLTIVGVMAAGARDHTAAPVPHAWIPSRALPALSLTLPFDIEARFERPNGYGFDLAGRLGPGVDGRTAEAELNVASAAYADFHEVTPLDVSVTSTAYANHPNGRAWMQTLSLLSMAAMLMLLLGCANVANLQLARALSRAGELGIRQALGAARGRLVRQSLVESLLLCLVAGGTSLVLAGLVTPVLTHRLWSEQAGIAEVGWRAGLFASGLAIAACLLAGLLPALSTTRFSGSVRYARSGAPRLRAALLAFQLAASVVLLIGAGLLVRSIHHVSGAGLGFDLSGTAAVRINPPSIYTEADREQLARAIIEAADRLGLPRVAGSFGAPYAGPTHWGTGFRAADEAIADTTGVFTQVSPQYFEVVGIPLKAGRLFDDTTAPGDVVVSEQLARWLSPGGGALERVFFDRDRELRVIGIVGDARSVNVGSLLPTYYEYRPAAFSVMLVRNEPGAAGRLRDLIQAIEPAAAPEIRPVGAELWEQLRRPLVFAAGGMAVAFLALTLAAVGTLGVFSYAVSERTREIGVRMVLGARARDIVRMLVARLAWPLAGGLAAGLLGAQALGEILGNRLYGLSPRDPVAYLTVLVVLLVAATVAIWLPARRAVRVDPAVTLRAE